MRNFYYGNFESKIREKISETVQKGKFLKFEYPLVPDNISEILSGIFSESLFGDKNIYVIDITESEFEDIEKFIQLISPVSEVIVIYRDDLDKNSKILKLFSKEFYTQEFKKSKTGNIFSFTDSILLGDLNKTYLELKKLDENEVLIFNNIVSVARNLLALKLDLSIKSKIIPFKLGLYKKSIEYYSKQDLTNIYSNLAENDLRFKRGEINSEMLLLHSINLFFINKNGDIKQK